MLGGACLRLTVCIDYDIMYVNGGVCDIDDISDKLVKCLRILWS